MHLVLTMNEKEIAKELILLFRALQIKPLRSSSGTNADDSDDSARLNELGFYFAGIAVACRICGFKIKHPLIEEIVFEAHGLVMTPTKSPVSQFREQGLDDDAIYKKLLDLQIDILRKAYEITDV